MSVKQYYKIVSFFFKVPKVRSGKVSRLYLLDEGSLAGCGLQ